MKNFIARSIIASGIAAFACGCGGSGGSSTSQGLNQNPGGNNSGAVQTIFAVDTSDNLYKVTTDNFAAPTSVGSISGLQPGERILGLTFSPENVLYGLGSTSRLYQIDPVSAQAASVGTGAAFTPALSGSNFGFSFNPVTYQIRVNSDTGQNLLLDSNTGNVFEVDTALAYASTDIHAGAVPKVKVVSSSCSCEHPPSLYGIDTNLGILVSVGSPTGSPVDPATGQLFTVGSLGVSSLDQVAMAQPQKDTIAYVAASQTTAPGVFKFYSVDLSSGAATLLGPSGSLTAIRSISVLNLD